MPVLLGALTLSGLVSALLSEGAGDVWSWLALGVPVAVVAWYGLVPRARAEHDSPDSPSPLEEFHP